jgi:hypothetical protein
MKPASRGDGVPTESACFAPAEALGNEGGDEGIEAYARSFGASH